MSDFRFACPHCGQRIQCDATNRGTQISCPACRKTLTIPAPPARAQTSGQHGSGAGSTAGGKAGLSALALISFVCSLGLAMGSIPAIVCGHLARKSMRRDPSLRGNRLALAGLGIAYFTLLGTITFATVGFLGLKPRTGHQLTAEEQAANTPAVLAARRVDVVQIGDFESEIAHQMKTRFSGSGQFSGRMVRDARSGGMISYDMKVDPVAPMSLHCTYWGNDSGGRRFDILVNETVIATQVLDFNDAGHFFDVEYEIPEALTRGRTNVSVIFQGYPRKTVGGIYGCQMLRRKN